MIGLSQVEFIDEAIATQRSALRFQLALACATVALGLSIVVLTQRLAPEDLKVSAAVGGTLIPTLSAFPLKEMFAKRDKIAALGFLRQQLDRFTAPEVRAAEGEEFARVQQQFWNLLQQVLA